MRYSVITKNPEHGVYDREIGCYYMKKNSIAFYGHCQVRADEDSLFGGEDSKPFRSKVLFNPTWRKLYEVAKKQQQATKDGHHDFFEGINDTGKDLHSMHPNGYPVRVIELVLGS